MNEFSEFDKLAKELDDEEKKELLEKLKVKKNDENLKNVNREIKNIEKKYNFSQYSIAKQEFEKKNFWDKIVILLTAFFSGKKKEDVIINQKLNKIKKELITKYSNLINFENSQLTFNFLVELLNIFDIVKKLILLFNIYFLDSKYYFDFLIYLFESEFDDNINRLYKETNPYNLKLEGRFIDKQIYYKEKDQRINAFFSAIDNYKFERFMSEITKFEILLKLIQFNFSKLFIEFSFNYGKDKISTANFAYFRNVDIMLDNFNSIISELNFSIQEISFISQFPIYLKENLKQNDDEKNTLLESNDIDNIEKLLETIDNFKKKVPLNKIFQYFRKDLLYKPKSIYIEKKFIEKYKEKRRKEIDELWSSFYLELKKNELDRLIKDLFPDFNFNILENFNLKLYNQLEKNFSFKMTSIYNLNILIYFINKVYKSTIENVVNKIVIEANFLSEQSRFHLTAAYHTINNSVIKVKEFDNKFKFENEYGKRIIYFIAKSKNGLDSDQRKDLKQMLDEIKNVSNNIVKDLYNAINNIYLFFINVTDNNSKHEKYITNIENIKIIGQTILVAIEKAIDYIVKFFKVYKNIENIY